ncbi:MAG: RagB/SusD family nutrient uptake outer membrane protein [Saprospiraceae bacterium]|nr:RagB/SusD family nutrient uptake outer membrane protein [Saprospiraceae bacterium]
MKELLICLSFTCILIACDKQFDELAVNPSQQDVDNFYTSPENLDKGVIGVYGYITTPRNMGASGMGSMLSRGDEISPNSDYSVAGDYSSSYTPSFYTIVQPFQLMYTALSQANQMIEAIPLVDFANNERKDALLGEALFLRAFAHFYLLLNYRNIPLMEELPRTSNEYRAQATPDRAWDLITSDLIKARDLLPQLGYWGTEGKGRAVSGSAAALLGKVYLYRSGIEKRYGSGSKTYYNEAATEFGDIIEGVHGEYRLMENYDWNFDVAHENNDESLFEIQFLGDVVNTGFNPGFSTSGLFCDPRGKIPPMPTPKQTGQVAHDWLYNSFIDSRDFDGKTDPRMFSTLIFDDSQEDVNPRDDSHVTLLSGKSWNDTYGEQGFFSINDEAGNYKSAPRKWLDWGLAEKDPGNGDYFFNARAQGVNYRFIRLADVLLMYAESVISGGNAYSVSAIEAVNRVRERVQMPSIESVNMEIIESERILELSCEGHRFYDLLRWGKLPERFAELENIDPYFKRYENSTYTGFQEGKHEWMPIPIDEIEANPLITKNNPGW